MSQTLGRCHGNDFPGSRFAWANTPECFRCPLTGNAMVMVKQSRGIFVPHVEQERIDAAVASEQVRCVAVARTVFDLAHAGFVVRGAKL